jgi:hypothetical protein
MENTISKQKRHTKYTMYNGEGQVLVLETGVPEESHRHCRKSLKSFIT